MRVYVFVTVALLLATCISINAAPEGDGDLEGDTSEDNMTENTTESPTQQPSIIPPKPSVMPPTQKECGRSYVLKAMLEANQDNNALRTVSEGGSAEGEETIKPCIPWQVRVQISGYYFCGGSIISDRHILTAAHCLQKACNPEDLKVIIAGHRLDEEKSKGQEVYVRNMTVHPEYCPYTNVSNIAILTLQDPIKFNNPCVGKICWCPRYPFDDISCFVCGWRSKNLVKVTTHEGSKCNDAFKINDEYYIYNKEKMICAGNTEDEGSENPCKGDSGDPLVCLDSRTKKFTQVGIASHGNRCGRPNRPGVYTNVASFCKWIKQVMDETSPCLTKQYQTKIDVAVLIKLLKAKNIL